MTFPFVIETPNRLEPVVRDTFADDTVMTVVAGDRLVTWPFPRRRPLDA